MARLIFRIAYLLVLIKSSLILDYRFGSNSGQIFHDFEPNGGSIKALNGITTGSCNRCTKPTDRGAYFTSATYSTITLPPSQADLSQLKLSSDFVIAIWLLPICHQPGQILYRKLTLPLVQINFIILNSCDSKISLAISISLGITSTLTGIQNQFPDQTWSFLTFKMEGTFFRFYINDLKQGEANLSIPYDESSMNVQDFYLGNTYDGFIWDFKLFDSTIINSDYFGGLYFPGHCLTPSCPVSCPVSVKKAGVLFCLSDIIDPNESSQGSACSPSCIYGCANSICLACPCTFTTCQVNTAQQISIYCPNSLASSSKLCPDGKYYYDSYCFCSSECEVCTSPTTCSTCMDPNAVPDTNLCRCITGYYKDTSSGKAVCTPCNTECLSCDNSITCLSCKGDNMVIGNFQGCNCADGYYKSNTVGFSNCSPCPDQCLTCNIMGKCQKCKSLNSHLTLNGDCACDLGYINSTQLTSTLSCIKCNVECYECYQNLTCSTCAMINALPAETGCNCIEGYYKSSSQQKISCISCHQDCIQCDEALKCTKCKDYYKKPSRDQGCVCIDGYYAVDSNNCAQCPEDCITCKDYMNCISCIVDLANPNNRSSCDCPVNSIMFGSMCLCGFGFYMDLAPSGYYCKPCENNCKTCVNKTYCTSCINNLQLSKDNSCESCSPQMYLSNGYCLNCTRLCETCSKIECFSCVSNASNSKNCTCDEGFYQDDSQCRRLYFNASASIFKNDSIELVFSETPSINLTKDNFQVLIVPKVLFNFETYQKSLQVYLIVILLGENLKDGHRVSINIISDTPLTSENNYLYANQTLSLNLYKYYQYALNNLTDKVSNQTKAIIRYALATTISAGLLNNPSNAWILMNKVQLLSYIPLSSIELTPTLSRFFKSMGTNELVQNPLTWAPLHEALQLPPSSEPYLEARNYGIQTDSFIVNSGFFMVSFCFFITIIPLIWFLTKIKNGYIKMYAEKILKSYKYSFFLRFYMQSFLEITIFAIVQVRTISNNWFSILGSSLAIVVIALSASLTFIMPLFLYKSYNKIASNDREFISKFGSLFKEFKYNDGFEKINFYTVYCLRKLVFILCQVFLNSVPILQIIITDIYGIIQLAYLIGFRPFKTRIALISSFTVEICICTVNFCLLSISLTDNIEKKLTAEIVIIFIFYISISIQIILSIIQIIQCLVQILKNHVFKKTIINLKDVTNTNHVTRLETSPAKVHP